MPFRSSSHTAPCERASAWWRCRSSSATGAPGRARCPGASQPRRWCSCRDCASARRRARPCARLAAAALQEAAAPADAHPVDVSAYAFAHGVRHTRATLVAWQREPVAVVGRWAAGASAAAAGLAAAVRVGGLPHAVPELTALFLPLAAWIIASRRGQWEQLLAATFVTVALAIPVLLASAAVEVYVSPHLLEALTHLRPMP